MYKKSTNNVCLCTHRWCEILLSLLIEVEKTIKNHSLLRSSRQERGKAGDLPGKIAI